MYAEGLPHSLRSHGIVSALTTTHERSAEVRGTRSSISEAAALMVQAPAATRGDLKKAEGR